MRVLLISVAIVGIVASAADVGSGQAKPTSTPSMKGVWRGISTVATGADTRSNTNRLPNVLIYTDSHYCQVAQDGGLAALPPRKPVPDPKDPNKLTDAEKIARFALWDPLGVQCGTYTVKGNIYTHHPIITKDPPATGTTYPDQAPREFRLEGNNTLVQIAKSPDGKTETRRTYTRLE